MPADKINVVGLTNEQVTESRDKFGSNRLNYKRENGLLIALKGLAKEPMNILLLVTSSVYFLSGNTHDGIFLAAAIVLVSTISLYQDSRSRNALEKLKSFSQPNVKVIREGKVQEILSEEIVVGDSIMIEEGTCVPADCFIVSSNDFSVNESILTGEALSVYKDQSKENNLLYSGTTVGSGLAIATVSAIGNQTRLGKIGESLENIREEKTPLELQINNFVKKMVIAGLIVFIFVWAVNFSHSGKILDSLLKALTLAMSILPEEIPVAFTTFMALGAWRLMKMGIVVKQMKTVETLGSATVICTDKTGTLTENKMELTKLFALSSGRVSDVNDALDSNELDLIDIAMWASEPIPFDPMEIALHSAYGRLIPADKRSQYRIVHEYPLSGKPPMMTHVFENGAGHRIIAAKGAPEGLTALSNLADADKKKIEKVILDMAQQGCRVLAVAEAEFAGDNFPANQQDYKFHFKGIVAFSDPPKKNIREVLARFYKAGINVKIVTGDNAATTSAIARQVGFAGYEKSIGGDELMKLSESSLRDVVSDTQIFIRMFPEAKLKIIDALKANGEIVAMTGDGVNDGPALKAAHIGIAMGKKGTEIAKQAASLILLEDDLSKMVDAVGIGRKIYANLKKAIQYIISIHIPIILTVFIPLALGWVYPNIFSPVHIIFLELIMGPTCSIIYENEPMEQNTMFQKPRPFSTTFFNWNELATSVIQGLAITVGTLVVYRYSVAVGYDEFVTRTMVFTVLIAANVFLTLVNRSFYYSVITTMRYKNNLVSLIVFLTIGMTGLLLYVKPLTNFFQFRRLGLGQLLTCLTIGFCCVMWFEIVKWRTRSKHAKTGPQ